MAYGYEKCFDMPMGGDSPERHMSTAFARVIVAIVCVFCKVFFRYRVDGREKLAALNQDAGVLVAGNHTSYWDVFFLYLAVRPVAWPRFIARDKLFVGKPYIFGWILAHLGVFPIKRDTADKQALKRASKMLKDREVVCIYPEGTRRNKGNKDPHVHAGAAFIARMGKSPILPVTIRDSEKIKQKGHFIRLPKVTIEFGDPILLEDFDFLPKADRLEGCTWYVMRECFALSQRTSREEVDMPALFPDDKDYTDIFAEHPIPEHPALEYAEQRRAACASS